MSLRLSFRTWIFISTILVVVCTLTLVSTYLHRTLRNHTISQAREALSQQSILLREIVLDRWSPVFTDEQTDALADYLGEEIGLRVTLIRPDGAVIGDSEQNLEELSRLENHGMRPEIVQAMNRGEGLSLRHSSTIALELMYAAILLGEPEDPRLIIRLAMPLKNLAENIERVRKLIIWGSVLGVLLSLVVAFVVAQQVYRPVKELTRTALEISAGDLSQRLRRYPNHEIGDLGRAFDRMADHLQDEIEEVTRAKDRLEAILRAMVEGVLVVNDQGKITQANRALRELLDVKEQPVDKTLSELIRNADLIEAFQQVATGAANTSTEIRTLGKKPRILDVEVARLQGAGGQAGAVAVFHDITERKRIEEMRRDFVAGVSHELRTPLASIKGAVETLIDGAIDNPKFARRFTEVIHRNADRLENIIVDLMSLARLESGELTDQQTDILLESIANASMSAVADWAATKNVELTRELPAEPVYLSGDQRQLVQALTNLLDNAVKYSEPEDKVLLSAFMRNGMVHINVTDTGIGIAQEHLPRIFERFYRVDANRSREQGGTGLGLAIVKHTAQVHGGKVEVESFPGKGSSFSLILPAH